MSPVIIDGESTRRLLDRAGGQERFHGQARRKGRRGYGRHVGIGLATAQRLANEGAYVFITGRRQTELDAAVKQIGRNVTGVQGDVAKLADQDRLYATVKKEKRFIDILFANAGIAKPAPLGEITEEHFDEQFDINVKGTLFTVQKALPLLRDGATIILNASIVGSKGFNDRRFSP